jgi:serine/threonine-protein kinase
MTRLRSIGWRRLQEVFEAAAGLEADARRDYLDANCTDDPGLRRQVESLLLHLGNDVEFAPAPADADDVETLDAGCASLAGQRLGPWRLEREIGEGGMGTVYLAVRADDAYRKQVAVKVLRAGLHGGAMRARFKSERQILAQLDHPNIARLLDGGTTEAGVPYLVMEYVAGAPITTWCDERSLPVRERLALFRKVCSAVQYAHAHLVVHRDLKPSNILVTEDGTPKLLDFGIAKLLTDEAEPGFTMPVTEAGLRLMTPEYASPEQVRGEAVTTACDVYALGVVLYELLAGRRPFTFDSRLPREIERRVLDETPKPPGAGDDLDNIVLLAMDKDRARRYATVDQLDEDIGRHLDGLPVTARPATFTYRARKFARRHRAGVAAAAAFLVLLTAFAIVMTVTASRLKRERDRAVSAEQQSQQIASFLAEIFNVSNPSEQRGRTITAQEILDQGAARIDKELAGQPLVQAALMDTIGKVYQNLGLYQSARGQLARSLAIREQALGPEALDTLQSKNDLAEIDRIESKYDAAERAHRAVLAAREARLPADDPKIAESLNNVGLVLAQRQKYQEAEPLYRRALDIRRRALGERAADTTVTMSNLGQVLEREGRLDEAEEMYRRTLEIRRAVLGPDHPRTLNTTYLLATVLGNRGKYAEAEPMLRDVLAARRRILGDRHSETASSMNNLASLLQDEGKLDEAEALYREALAVQRATFGEQHQDVAVTLNNLASLRESRGDAAGAEPLYRESLGIREALFGPKNASVARARHNLGRVLIALGRTAEGELDVRQALETRRALLPPDHPDIATSLITLGALDRQRGRPADAEAELRDAAAIRVKKLGADHPQTAIAQVSLAEVLVDRGACADATALLTPAIAVLRKAFGPTQPDLARAERALGRCPGIK